MIVNVSKWWMLVQTAKCLSTLFAHGRLLPHERAMKSVNRGWRREVPCMCPTKRPFLIFRYCVKLTKKILLFQTLFPIKHTLCCYRSANVQKEKCPRFTLKQSLLSLLHSRIPFHFNLRACMYAGGAFFLLQRPSSHVPPFSSSSIRSSVKRNDNNKCVRRTRGERAPRSRVRDAKEAPKINENGTEGPNAAPWS